LVLLLLLGLVLFLPFKNACVQRQVAGHAHFYCLSTPWRHSEFWLCWDTSRAEIEQPTAYATGNSPG
jgi:hypothetical protein